MKIVVTGGAGFIGSHLVDSLIQQGHKVTVIDDLTTGSESNLNKKAYFQKIPIQSTGIKKIFRGQKYQYVFHLAAQKSVVQSLNNPLKDAEQNIMGSLNILETLRELQPSCHMVFFSTGGAIYGDTRLIPTPEKHTAQPSSPYGIAKYTVEQYLDFYKKIHKISSTVLRCANVYGPRQDPKGEAGVVAIFMNDIRQGKTPQINGNGRQTRDFIYVKDVVVACLQTVQKKPETTLNISTGSETSIKNLLQQIKKISHFLKKDQYRAKIKGEQQRSCLDNRRAKKVLGWKPQHTLEKGLKETWDWFTKID